MEPATKWYHREPLPSEVIRMWMAEEGFRSMSELSPHHPQQREFVNVGDKIAILMNNGLLGYYTVTRLQDVDGSCVVGRDETGVDEKGTEFALDSSLRWCQDRGYKVLPRFPWEDFSAR